MLRRTAAQRISNYEFGHPKLTQFFGSITLATKAKAEDVGVKSSVLPNGTKVVTHDRDGLHSSIGFYVDAGSKYDPVAAPGLSYVLRWALLTSNFENSLFQIDRQFRALGASYEHTEVNKRFLGWKSEVRRDHIVKPVQTIATCITAPRFPESDIERFRDTMDNILTERRLKEPHLYVVDQLESVAFWKEPLGSPRFVPPFSNDLCSSALLTDQWASLFQPNRVVLAGVNVDHHTLVSAYTTATYTHDASAPHHARANKNVLTHTAEKFQYRAGEQRHEHEMRAKEAGTSADMRVDSTGAIGWLTNGREGGVKEYAVSTVIRELINTSVAATTNPTLHENDADGLRAFYRPYSTAGLIGLSFKGPSSDALAAFSSIKLPGANLDAAAVEAAKATALVRFYSEELEVQRAYLDFIATSTFTAEEFVAALQQITAADVKKEVDSIRSKAPVMFASGDVQSFPSLKQLNLNA